MSTKLENTKIEDASESLKGFMRELIWLEQNGWTIVQTGHNDIIGQGCGIYPSSKSVDVHIHMMQKKDVTATKFYLFEDKTTMKELS